VIRSGAGPLLYGLGGKSGDCDSSHARMATSANLDSDMCRWAATAVNQRFSSSVGRAVIVSALDFELTLFTARKPELQQNADTSLSCHHSKKHLSTLLAVSDNSSVLASTSSSAGPELPTRYKSCASEC
jgi:hypothetical protein